MLVAGPVGARAPHFVAGPVDSVTEPAALHIAEHSVPFDLHDMVSTGSDNRVEAKGNIEVNEEHEEHNRAAHDTHKSVKEGLWQDLVVAAAANWPSTPVKMPGPSAHA